MCIGHLAGPIPTFASAPPSYVRTVGTDYQNTWSGSEVLGVRAVLGGPGDLDAACPVWAPTLWGTTEAALDATCGYGVTRRWFAAVAQTEAPNYVDTLEMTEAEKASLAASHAAIGDLAHARGGGADREGTEAALAAVQQTNAKLEGWWGV